MQPLTVALLLCTIVWTEQVHVPATTFWNEFSITSGLPTLQSYTPQFSIELVNVSLLGSQGPYSLPTYIVSDTTSNVVVATYTPYTSALVQSNGSSMGEINLLCPVPALCPTKLPALPRYGWAWLWGAKMTTIPWLDCCSVTGDQHGFSISPDPSLSTVTLQEWQVWLPNGTHPGRDALSNHTSTLAWHGTLGYIVEVTARLRINAAAAPKAVEFLNYLPPRLMQPWPEGLSTGGWGATRPSGYPLPQEAGPWPLPHSTLTAWANDTAGVAWRGFSENILAGAELRTYALPSPCGALGAWGDGQYSPALAYSLQGLPPGATMLQQTCPTWGDQHQVVSLPPSPGPDGYYDLAPSFTSAWLPPPASTYVAAHAQVEHEAGQDGPPYPMQRWLNSTMIRVGVVEDFEGQPLPLTLPTRALAQAWSQPDYSLRTGPGAGFNGSNTALQVQPMTVEASLQPYSFSNPQPLIPLNVSSPYTFTAWLRLPEPGGGPQAEDVTAWLWMGLYEADDFNAGIAQGPTYGRTGGSWNSSAACTLTTCPPGTWVQLVLGPMLTPPWPAYADVRVLATSQAGAGAGEVLLDNWYFGPPV